MQGTIVLKSYSYRTVLLLFIFIVPEEQRYLPDGSAACGSVWQSSLLLFSSAPNCAAPFPALLLSTARRFMKSSRRTDALGPLLLYVRSDTNKPSPKCQEGSFCKVLQIEYSNLPIQTPCACKRDARRVFETNFPSLPSAWQGRVASLGTRSPSALCSISADYPYTRVHPYKHTRRHARLPLPESATMKIPSRSPGVDPSGAAQVFCTVCTTMVLFGVLGAAKDMPSSTWRTYLI